MTDLTERLRKLLDDATEDFRNGKASAGAMAEILRAGVSKISGRKRFAETTDFDADGRLIAETIIALPGLATTIETLTQENARLKEAMKQALNAPMIDHNDSSRSVYGILRKALGGGDEA